MLTLDLPPGPGICALALMAKTPAPGRSKTRLSPPLTPREAAALSEAFVRDTARHMAQASGLGVASIAVWTPAGTEEEMARILPEDFGMWPQRGSSLGERLTSALEDLFSQGFGSVILLGSDSPTLPAATLAKAVRMLAEPGDRAVLGPTDDGGYCLLGLKRLHRELFRDIDWSTERVRRQTVERAKEIALPLTELPTWWDVDDGPSLARLCGELFGPHPPDAPHTRKFLAGLIAREGRGRVWPERG